MSQVSRAPQAPPKSGRAAAIPALSGVVFAVLLTIGMVIIRMALPDTPADRAAWATDPTLHRTLAPALQLVPFIGIAFIWFIAELRHRQGQLADPLFSTVNLGDGLLFIAMLFGSAAMASGTMEVLASPTAATTGADTITFGQEAAYALLTTFGLKMAGMFIFTTSAIGRKTGIISPMLVKAGYITGLALVLIISKNLWIELVFPAWVLVVSLDFILSSTRPARTA